MSHSRVRYALRGAKICAGTYVCFASLALLNFAYTCGFRDVYSEPHEITPARCYNDMFYSLGILVVGGGFLWGAGATFFFRQQPPQITTEVPPPPTLEARPVQSPV